jgi:hypothetical protein
MDLLSEHSEPFSATWPSSGTTRSGVAFELPTPALPTAGTASSSLPTPRASRGSSGTETMYALGAERVDDSRPQGEVVMLPTPLSSDGRGIGVHGQGGQDLRTTVSLLKTPLSNLGQNGGSQHPDKRKAGGHGPTLADEVEHLLPTPTTQPTTGNGHARDLRSESMSLLPTPTTMAGGQATRSGARSDELLLPGIGRELALLPTPAAHDSGNTPENHLRKKPGRSVVTSLQVLVDHDLIATGGRIAPPSTAGSESPDE